MDPKVRKSTWCVRCSVRLNRSRRIDLAMMSWNQVPCCQSGTQITSHITLHHITSPHHIATTHHITSYQPSHHLHITSHHPSHHLHITSHIKSGIQKEVLKQKRIVSRKWMIPVWNRSAEIDDSSMVPREAVLESSRNAHSAFLYSHMEVLVYCRSARTQTYNSKAV